MNAVLVLSNPAWEPGVIGIVASRLVELYGKPVVMIATPPDSPGRASARSVEGVDITAAIASQAALLLGYGGHAMAAGFSIRIGESAGFPARAGPGSGRSPGGSRPAERRKLQIDTYLPWKSLSLETVAEIERLAPLWAGQPAPGIGQQGPAPGQPGHPGA